MSITVDRRIELEELRCWECGRFWAREPHIDYICPFCAQRRVNESTARVAELLRSNSALRGALKRRKR